MKRTLLIIGMAFLFTALNAQSTPTVTSATINETPADSSGAGERVLELLLPSLDNVEKVHVSIMSGTSVTSSTAYDISTLTVWERGTKTNPEGFALYIPLPAASGMSLSSFGGTGTSSTVKVELADPSGNKGTATTAIDNN